MVIPILVSQREPIALMQIVNFDFSEYVEC